MTWILSFIQVFVGEKGLDPAKLSWDFHKLLYVYAIWPSLSMEPAWSLPLEDIIFFHFWVIFLSMSLEKLLFLNYTIFQTLSCYPYILLSVSDLIQDSTCRVFDAELYGLLSVLSGDCNYKCKSLLIYSLRNITYTTLIHELHH